MALRHLHSLSTLRVAHSLLNAFFLCFSTQTHAQKQLFHVAQAEKPRSQAHFNFLSELSVALVYFSYGIESVSDPLLSYLFGRFTGSASEPLFELLSLWCQMSFTNVKYTWGCRDCKNIHIYRYTYNQKSEKHGDPAGNNIGYITDCSIITVGFNQINENMMLWTYACM